MVVMCVYMRIRVTRDISLSADSKIIIFFFYNNNFIIKITSLLPLYQVIIRHLLHVHMLCITYFLPCLFFVCCALKHTLRALSLSLSDRGFGTFTRRTLPA